MSLEPLSLGERIVMAARLAAAEHLRQDADAAGINVHRLQREADLARANAARAAFTNLSNPSDALPDSFRQDLYQQPTSQRVAAAEVETPKKRSTKRRVA